MQRLAATNSRIDKEQILFDTFMSGCVEFFVGARLALDPLRTFGVKKVAEIIEDDGGTGDYQFTEFLALAKDLQDRKLTGHAARDAIRDAAMRCDAAIWNEFYRRVLLKDLKIGIDAGTLNKVLNKVLPTHPAAEQYLVPVFKCQLAHDGEDAQHQKKVRGRKLIDTKLDGVRALAMLDAESGLVNLFTRNGQSIESMPEIAATLQAVVGKLPGPLMLDGELISPKGFQHLMTLLKRKEPHPDTALVRYALFDMMPLADFNRGRCDKPQRERRSALEALHQNRYFVEPEILCKRLYVVPQIEVDLDTTEGQAAFAEYNRQVVADGFEGIMIKDPEAPYEGKRTAAWLKKKPIITVTLQIVGFKQGDPDKKYAHTLGSLVCAGHDMDVDIRVNVEGGISDKLRDDIWQHQDQYLGLLVDVDADKLSLEDGATVHSLRFPRLKGFRGRVAGEKI